MRFEGTLAKWNEERGFGFILPTQGGQELFAHVSAFPRDGRRPQLHEKLSFEVASGQAGKKQAVSIQRLGAEVARPAGGRRTPPQMARSPSTGLFGKLVALLLVCALLGAGYLKYGARQQSRAAAATGVEALPWQGAAPAARAVPVQAEAAAPLVSSAYRCDGRQHCSQMRSCAEATFFLKNCPGVKMDGNGDGVPCEQQWCTGPLGN